MFFPPKCGICGKFNQNYLCKKCYNLLNAYSKFNIISSSDLEKHNNEIFYNFDYLFYIFEYQGMVREMIINYKFNDNSYIYNTILNYVLKEEILFEILKGYDTIIPVPISKKRMKKRGYNQSLLISNEISKKLGIICEKDCLFKIKDNISQSKLNKKERINNVKNVYELKNLDKIKNNIYNKKIILFDDIYTTGSTVNECSKVLKNARSKRSISFSLSKRLKQN